MGGVLNSERLAKILALADSPVDGEALAALRLAQNLLAVNGLTFADLLAAGMPFHATELQRENTQLKQNLAVAHADAERWKSLALAMGGDSARHIAAAEKWRALARTAADHLWELGRQLQGSDEMAPDGSGNVVQMRVKR